MKIKELKCNFTEKKVNNVLTKVFDNQNVLKIKDICTVVRGGSPRPIQDYLTKNENDMPWLKIRDATSVSKYIEKTNEYIKRDGVKFSRVVNPGDLIVSNSATPGIPRIMKTTACIHDGWLLLTELSKDIDKNYLFYIFYLIKNQLVNRGQGSIFKNLSKEILSDFEIKIHSDIKLQEKIAYILSTQEDQIEKIKGLIKKLETRNQYYAEKLLSGELRLRENEETGKVELYKNEEWQEIVLNGKKEKMPKGWKKEKLKDKASLISGYSFKSSDMKNMGSYPVIKMSNFKEGFVEINELSKFTELEIEKVLIEKEDMLMGLSGSVGSMAKFDLNVKAYLNQRCIIIRSKENQNYVNYCLKHIIQRYIKDNSFGGVISNLSNKDVEDFEIMWSNEHQLIANTVKEFDFEFIKVKKILKLEEKRFQWMLDNLLSGEYEVVVED